MEPGDALFFHANLLHTSDQNKEQTNYVQKLLGEKLLLFMFMLLYLLYASEYIVPPYLIFMNTISHIQF